MFINYIDYKSDRLSNAGKHHKGARFDLRIFRFISGSQFRVFSTVFIGIFLSACGSNKGGYDETEFAQEQLSTQEQLSNEQSMAQQADGNLAAKKRNDTDALAEFLSDYLRLNLLDRVENSRKQVDRSEIEIMGRLPSKALYKSLGYRLRESFVALPPELEIRPYASRDDVLQSKLLEDLELTWAMLDTTLVRLESAAVKRKEGHDWVTAVTRRNLLQEATNYWFQSARQKDYLSWLNTLSNKTEDLFSDIAYARENYDVQDLRNQELALLDLRADSASLFQFYSSEQARLYNRIESRSLPQQAAEQRNYFHQKMSCSANSSRHFHGERYLIANHPNSMAILNLPASIDNDKKISYELTKLVRELSIKALRLHSQRSQASLARYNKAVERAEHQKRLRIESLITNLHSRQELGEEVDLNIINKAESESTDLLYRSIDASYKERQLSAALRVLADLVAQKLITINQVRLNAVLTRSDHLFVSTKLDTWSSSKREAQVLRALLLEVYDNSLIDLLLGYERAVFTNLLMHRGCLISAKVNSYSMGTPRKVIDDVAQYSRNYHAYDLPVHRLGKRYRNYKQLENTMNLEDITSQYRLEPIPDYSRGFTSNVSVN